ncbi:MAG: hypothetical protein ACK50E_02375 [Bacteroidota bacterium]|jgi:hypothetical protein
MKPLKIIPMKKLLLSGTMLMFLFVSSFAGNAGGPGTEEVPKTGKKDLPVFFQKIENHKNPLLFTGEVFGYKKNQKVRFHITEDVEFTGVLSEILINEENGSEEFRFVSTAEKGVVLTLNILRSGDPDLIGYACKLTSPSFPQALVMEKLPESAATPWVLE